MTSQPLQISWNNFTGGMNDQKYQAPAGRYYTGYGVNTRQYDVKPTRGNTLVRTYPDGIRALLNNEIVGGSEIIAWLDNGKIYGDGTEQSAILGTAKQGSRIGYMTVSGVNKLYYFHDTIPTINPKYIHRTDIDGTNLNENYRSYTSTSGNQFLQPPNGMQVKSEGSRILFSYYNEIWEIDNSEVVTKLISFPKNENVVGITQFQGTYKVYTSTGFLTSSLYVWDGTSSLPEQNVSLDGLSITSVINDGAYDYVVADNNLYLFAGVQYQKLYNGLALNGLGKVGDDIYFNLEQDNINRIAIYGNLPGYAKSLTPSYVVDIANPLNSVNTASDSLVYDSSNRVYVASNRSLYELDYGGAVNGTQYFESLVFVGNNIQNEKSITEIILKFSGATATCLIELYAQIQENGTWVKLYSGKNADITGINHGLKIHMQQFLNPIGNFNTIRFKIAFVRTGSDRATFYGLDLFGNENVGK